MTTRDRIVQLIHAHPARLSEGAPLIDANAAHKIADALIADGAVFAGGRIGQDEQDEIDRISAVLRVANASMPGAEHMYDHEVLTYATALVRAGMGDVLEARIRELARTQTGFPESIGTHKTGRDAFFAALKWFRGREADLTRERKDAHHPVTAEESKQR